MHNVLWMVMFVHPSVCPRGSLQPQNQSEPNLGKWFLGTWTLQFQSYPKINLPHLITSTTNCTAFDFCSRLPIFFLPVILFADLPAKTQITPDPCPCLLFNKCRCSRKSGRISGTCNQLRRNFRIRLKLQASGPREPSLQIWFLIGSMDRKKRTRKDEWSGWQNGAIMPFSAPCIFPGYFENNFGPLVKWCWKWCRLIPCPHKNDR